MAVVAHFDEDGGNCGRRRHRGEVLGEVGKRMSAKSGPASRREGAGEPFRNVWSLVSLQVFHRYTTQGIIGSRPGPPAVLCIIRIILYYLLIRIMYCRTLGGAQASRGGGATRGRGVRAFVEPSAWRGARLSTVWPKI